MIAHAHCRPNVGITSRQDALRAADGLPGRLTRIAVLSVWLEVSKTTQPEIQLWRIPLPMGEPIQILTVERDGKDGLLVTFSDGTVAGYVTEELLELRPFREPTAASRSLTMGA